MDSCTGTDCFLCKNISDDWLEMVKLKREVLTYKKGDYIFKEQEKVKGIYFILTGKVKVSMTWGDKNYIVRLASDGAILGHRGYGLDEVYPIDGIALEKTTVCFIPTELFFTLLKTNVNLLFKLNFFYADELKLTERKLKNLATRPVKYRVAEAIVNIAKTFGTDENGFLSYNISRKDMAAMAGTVYETVSRMLAELQKTGCIEMVGSKIKILQLIDLEKLCETENIQV